MRNISTKPAISLASVASASALPVFHILMLLGCVLLLVPATAFSQTVAQDGPQPTKITRPTSGTEDNDTRYRIGAGDVLSILVRKAPELSMDAVRVDQRGMIRIPMVEGDLQAACKTESELAEQIAKLYLEYKHNPLVEVFVKEFQSRPVAVIGAVNSAAQFRLQRRVRLLELISAAGGPSGKAGRIVEVIHTGDHNLCEAKPTGKDDPLVAQRSSVYNLFDMLKGKDGSNPFVLAGDIVQVPDADQVFIIGHVMSPQAIPLRDKQITISRAIAITGGPQRDASVGRIRITRQAVEGGPKQEIYVDLKAVLKEKAQDVALMPNDIVEVPSSTGKTILGALTGAIAPVLTQVPVRMIP